MRDFVTGLITILCCLALSAAVVVGAEMIFKPQESQASKTEREFREACGAVNGRTAWTGRHWECLK